MFKIVLLLMTCLDEPNRPSQESSSRTTLCARPVARTVEREPTHSPLLVPIQTTDQELSINDWLSRWELATRQIPVWSRSQREEFRRTMFRDFSRHTSISAELLVDHVDGTRLKEVFGWRIVELTSQQVTLEATPHDDVERLFYAAFRVSMSVEEGNPFRIDLIRRNQTRQTIWQSENRSIADDDRLSTNSIVDRHDDTGFSQSSGKAVQLVRFDEGIPPAPRRFIRTAALQID